MIPGVTSSSPVLADISSRFDEYWAAIFTVPVVVAALVGLRNGRRHRKETREWLSGRDSGKNAD